MTRTEICGLSLAATLLALAALVALQPLFWHDPVPTPAQLYTYNRGK